MEGEVRGWVGEGLQLTNVQGRLERRGVVVPYRTLHRFAVERCGFGRRRATLRVADGEAGVECQVDFGRLGLMLDPDSGRRRAVHALIFTAVLSRHMFVWLSFRQRLDDVIAGCEAAWTFFDGMFQVLIPDNLKPVVTNADPVNPRFSVGWLDYVQARGFGTDPARVRSPQDKPRVERVVQYVRGNLFAGETFLDLADAQRRVERWCATTAGLRVHGTTAQRPAEHFAAAEQQLLLPAPDTIYDVPVFARPKVARDRHVEVAKALYSVPGELIGQRLHARADSRLVKLYQRGQAGQDPPAQAGRWPLDRPGRSSRGHGRVRATRRRVAHEQGAPGRAVGRYLRTTDPRRPTAWTSMRAVYRLLGLTRSYGPAAVDTACARALALDVVDVRKIARMLEQALENQPALAPVKVVGGPARFARNATEFRAGRPAPGGAS